MQKYKKVLEKKELSEEKCFFSEKVWRVSEQYTQQSELHLIMSFSALRNNITTTHTTQCRWHLTVSTAKIMVFFQNATRKLKILIFLLKISDNNWWFQINTLSLQNGNDLISNIIFRLAAASFFYALIAISTPHFFVQSGSGESKGSAANKLQLFGSLFSISTIFASFCCFLIPAPFFL